MSSPSLPLQTTDIHIYTSTHSASGATYLGGARTTNELSDNYLHNFFNKTTPEQLITGITKFRCGYIYNSNPKEYIKNPILFVVSDTTSTSDSVSVGWGTSKIGNNLAGQPAAFIEQTIADQHTFPVNVSFFSGNNRNEGAILNADIAPLTGKAFWVKYNSQFNATEQRYNNFRLRLVADNLLQDVPDPTGNPIPPVIEIPVIGEGSSDIDFSKILKAIFARFPDFIVTTGNNNVDSDASFFMTSIRNYVSRLMLSFGYKDIVNPSVRNRYINDIAKFKFLPQIVKRYYSKDYGNVHILVMDTSGEVPYTNPSPQYSFIVKDLHTAFTNPQIDWILVFSNRAMYASQTTSDTRFLYADLRDTYHQLFTDNGVLLFIQGTFRFYEMSKVLQYNPSVPANPVTFDYGYTEADPDPKNNFKYTFSGKKSFQDGIVCVCAGVSGATHDVITSIAGYSRFRNYIDFGFFNIKINNVGIDKQLITRFYSTGRDAPLTIHEVTFERKEFTPVPGGANVDDPLDT